MPPFCPSHGWRNPRSCRGLQTRQKIALPERDFLSEKIRSARQCQNCIQAGFGAMLCLFYGVPEGLPVSVFRWSVVWQHNFPANHSAFAGVILILAVIKTVKLFCWSGRWRRQSWRASRCAGVAQHENGRGLLSITPILDGTVCVHDFLDRRDGK
jgi:hypothetical protein